MTTPSPLQYVLWGVKKAHGQTPLKLKIGTTIPQKDQDLWKREGWTCVVLPHGASPVGLTVPESQKVTPSELPACHS